MSLDMAPISLFGMTESSGGVTSTAPGKVKLFTCGTALRGLELKIDKPDEEGVGEVCMKGRSMFMGYFKNLQATEDMYDADGFIHSGDLGSLKDGFLEIKGRLKEIIITAGGENIAPVLIEHAFQEQCPVCANVMVVGDNRKFIAALITLKVAVDKEGKPAQELTKECQFQIKQLVGYEIHTVRQAKESQEFMKYIQKCVDQANSNAISRAQHIRQWVVLDHDFSIAGGELTPSLKLKRKAIESKYEALIEALYQEPKL